MKIYFFINSYPPDLAKYVDFAENNTPKVTSLFGVTAISI